MSAIGNKEIMAKNLRFYIERSGKERKELAKAWGFPYSTVSEWLTGKKYPRIDRIEIMADYFGIQKSDLIEEHTEDTIEKSAFLGGLTANQKALIDFAQSVPDDKAEMILRVMKSILEVDR